MSSGSIRVLIKGLVSHTSSVWGSGSEPTSHQQISLFPVLKGTALHSESVGKNWGRRQPTEATGARRQAKEVKPHAFALVFSEMSVWSR